MKSAAGARSVLRARPWRTLLLCLPLVAGACTSIHFREIRAPFRQDENLQIHCAEYPGPIASINEYLSSRYAVGWRLAVLGDSATTVLGITASTTPVFCLERRAPTRAGAATPAGSASSTTSPQDALAPPAPRPRQKPGQAGVSDEEVLPWPPEFPPPKLNDDR